MKLIFCLHHSRPDFTRSQHTVTLFPHVVEMLADSNMQCVDSEGNSVAAFTNFGV